MLSFKTGKAVQADLCRNNGAERLRTSLLPASMKLMAIIRCNCKASTGRCTCKKHGLQSSYACGAYKAISCLNSATPRDKDSDSEEE